MTTVTVRLPARTARALAERARREGRSLDGLLADLAEQAVREPAPRPLAALLADAPLLGADVLGRDRIYGPDGPDAKDRAA